MPFDFIVNVNIEEKCIKRLHQWMHSQTCFSFLGIREQVNMVPGNPTRPGILRALHSMYRTRPTLFEPY